MHRWAPTRNWPRHNRQGIHANDTYPADFLYDNLAVEANVIHAAWRSGVRKRPFLGSTCIYPKLSPQPLREEYLLTGPLEPTNEWYAVGKIAGIKAIAPGKALLPVGGPPRADLHRAGGGAPTFAPRAPLPPGGASVPAPAGDIVTALDCR